MLRPQQVGDPARGQARRIEVRSAAVGSELRPQGAARVPVPAGMSAARPSLARWNAKPPDVKEL